jgi:hypothetical protein
MALALVPAVAAAAHDVVYQGTVVHVERERLQVRTIDEQTKKGQDLWFVVTKDTKVRRGDRPVSYAEAGIAPNERIVVVVTHGGEDKHVASELRLAAR